MKKFICSTVLIIVLAVILKMPVFTANAANMSIDMDASYTGELTNDNKGNYYEFIVPESGRVRVNVTTTMGWTYYNIYDSNNVKVWGQSYSNGVDQNVDLVAGTYYFYVGKNDYTGNYSFKLSFVSANESFGESVGDKKNSMSDASVISLGENYSGQLAINDTVDYYEFTVPESGRVRVNVTTTMGWTYYNIYNSSNVKVWGQSYSNGVDQNVDLVAGTYYFYVGKDDYTGNYSFKLSFVSANESIGESVGDKKNSMSDASVISLGENYSGQLAINDTVDYYEFTVPESGRVRVNVTTTMGWTYYNIYDSSNVKVWGQSYSNGVDQNVDLVAGTYYFYVGKNDYTGNYSFKLSFVSANESFGESVGDKKNSISDAPTIFLGKSYNGQLATNDTIDYYKFNISESGKVHVNVTTTMGWTYYNIYNSSNVKVWGKSYSNGVNQDVDLVDGTYYFYVGKNDSTGNYSFSISGDMDTYDQDVYDQNTDDQDTDDWDIDDHECVGTWITTLDATCTEAGKREYICDICAKTLQTQLISATGHSYGDWIVYRTATCSAEGLRYSFCVFCGMEVNESIPKLTHVMTDWNVTKAATCYSEGTQTRTCMECGTAETQKLSVLDHEFGEWKVVKNASCDQPGSEERVCSLCGKKESREISSASGHQYGDWKVVTQATCGQSGKEERVCSLCGNKESREIPLSSKHQYGDWKVVTQATCSKSGKEERTCSICGNKESKEISALKHTYEDWKVVTQATCGQSGKEERVCSVCGKKESREISALEHKYGDWKVVIPATCTKSGTEERVCSLCSDKESREISVSIAHTYGDWKVITPAKCDQAGTKERICTLCGDIETQTIEALLHEYGEYEIISGSKLIPPMVKERKCSVCGNFERINDWSYIWVTVLAGIAAIGLIIGTVNYIRAFAKKH